MYDEVQQKVAYSLIVKREEIEAELLRAAKLIRDSANSLIAKEDAVHHRKPPCALAVKTDGRSLGPRIVWVRYSSRKYEVKERGKVRFTQEIPGRVNGKYRRSIFSKFDPALEEKLWEHENMAADLRKRISYWRAVMKEMEAIAAGYEPEDGETEDVA